MVRLTYYTDPACPWSWAAEPALRRLQMEFGTELQITYVMAGMARELDDPLQLLDATLEATAWSAMPVDPRIWRERPPRSTYPACQGVKAAAEQALDGPQVAPDALATARERPVADVPPRPSCGSSPLSSARARSAWPGSASSGPRRSRRLPARP
jgi:Thioredoxin